jgi:hypothetical protein
MGFAVKATLEVGFTVMPRGPQRHARPTATNRESPPVDLACERAQRGGVKVCLGCKPAFSRRIQVEVTKVWD